MTDQSCDFPTVTAGDNPLVVAVPQTEAGEPHHHVKSQRERPICDGGTGPWSLEPSLSSTGVMVEWARV